MLASIIVYPLFLNAGKQFAISKVVSLGIVDFLKSITNNVSIKWPNDIYFENKKIAGILIENTISGSNLQSSVIGIGLNLNQKVFLSDAPNPVSLKQISGVDYDNESVAKKVVASILVWYDKLQAGKIGEIESAYFSNLFRANNWSNYKKDGKLFEAKIVGIGEFGQLKLEKRDGSVETYLFKEVEFVI